MPDGKGKHCEKGGKSPLGHEEHHGPTIASLPKIQPETAPKLPPVIDVVVELPIITDVEALLKEIEATAIARPERVHSRELVALLPFYKPRPREPLLVVWTDLDYATILRLNKAKNSDDIRRILAERMTLSDSLSSPKDQIVLDLYCQVINQATKMQLNFEQTSAVFSIIKSIHEKAIETPVDNTKECLEYMDAILCRHIVKRPPWSARIFDVHQAALVRDYIIRTYFRHFGMYKYAFTPSVCMDLKIEYEKSAVAKPPSPSPDHFVHNPVSMKEVSLDEVLKEIDLEEQIEKAIADGVPLPLLPVVAAPPDQMIGPVTTATDVILDPCLAELEIMISKQMDGQLKILRDKITDKLRQIDQVLEQATGVQLPIDQFSVPAEEPVDASHRHHKSGKKSPHKAVVPSEKGEAKALAKKRKPKK